MKLVAGIAFPDLDLPDHTGRARMLSEVVGGDPAALLFSREAVAQTKIGLLSARLKAS